MNRRFVIDLARWERGELRLEELMAAHGTAPVIDLAETHAWVSFLATEPAEEPGPDWETLSARLEPRAVPRRHLVGFRQLVAATVAGALLTPATAYALGDGSLRQAAGKVTGGVTRLFTPEEERATAPASDDPPLARPVRVAAIPTPSRVEAPPEPVVPAAPLAPVGTPERSGDTEQGDGRTAPQPPADDTATEPAPPSADPAPESPAEPPADGGEDEVAIGPLPDESGVDDGWTAPPPGDTPSDGGTVTPPAAPGDHGHGSHPGPPNWSKGGGNGAAGGSGKPAKR